MPAHGILRRAGKMTPFPFGFSSVPQAAFIDYGSRAEKHFPDRAVLSWIRYGQHRRPVTGGAEWMGLVGVRAVS